MNIFDAHFHIIDPRYPLIENNGFLPEKFTAQMYQTAVKPFGIHGGVIISGSFQGFDQAYLLQALDDLGPSFVGVVNLPTNTPDKAILSLYEKRICAVRFNRVRSANVPIAPLVDFAKRIYDLCGMHVEFCLNGSQIETYFSELSQLPKFSIDHLGLSYAGFKSLLKLVERGAYVKASGFMRVDFEVDKALQTIYSINPHALMFGTDLPGTRASRQFNKTDLSIITNHFSKDEQANILRNNASSFYNLGYKF